MSLPYAAPHGKDTRSKVQTILAESMHFARIIPLDGRPQSGLSQFGGDGRGHHDADTLVVESSNFDGELTGITRRNLLPVLFVSMTGEAERR